MPRFYFHLQHEQQGCRTDEEGSDLPDEEAAWYHAFRSARDLIVARIDEAFEAADHSIQVEDEVGREVLSLPLIEVVELTR
ncbi:MAG: DUF6894 family protein [Allosphingosinicella sp.]|uniref:DUF6894 family protein n=1 Tax=Allosphingosinicella sp. TaxID=2823234 RepID=UPI0039221B01